MIVAVINFSGNVGKSTIAEHLLMPRMPGAEYITIETINSDGNNSTATNIRGKEFGSLQEELLVLDSAIVDIGASNVEDVMKLMKQYSGSHEDFDLFVVPAVKSEKEMQDTIATINALSALGVPAKKIRVVCNKVLVDDSVENDFYPVIAFQEAEKKCMPIFSEGIQFSPLYPNMKAYDVTMPTLLAQPKEHYKKVLVEAMKLKKEADKSDNAKDKQKAHLNVENAKAFVSMRRLAETANENLTRIWNAVIKK